MTRLIVLDRDGVINEDSDDYIKSADEYVPIDGSLEAIAKLNQAGYTVVVASNQSGLARGYFDENTLQQMHDKLYNLLSQVGGKIANIYVCPHSPDDNCNCRKPKPGLLKQIFEDYPANPQETIFIGDSLKDLQVAQALNMVPVLVRTGKGVITESAINTDLQARQQFSDVKVFNDLAQAVESLLTEQES